MCTLLFNILTYHSDSFRYPAADQFTLDQVNGRIKLPKLGWVRWRKSRDILGACRNATVTYTGGKWFVSIQTEREVEAPIANVSIVVMKITPMWSVRLIF